MLLQGSSSALATPLSFSVTFQAPYSGLRAQTGTTQGVSGCRTNSTFQVAPTAYPRSGSIRAEMSEFSYGCAPLPADAFVGANLGFSGPDFNATSNCTCNVSFEWNLSWVARLTAVPAPGSASAYADAQAQFELVNFVYDVTSQSYVGFADLFPWNVAQTNGTTVSTGHGQLYWANTTTSLSVGHEYELQSNFYVYLNSYTTSGSYAATSFDLATHGTHGRLVEMVVAG